MADRPGLTIQFGTTGNSLAYLGGGWARSEASFTWAVGEESHLLLPMRPDVDEMILRLRLHPFVHPPVLSFQRLTVSVNDLVIGSTRVYRPSVLAWRIPAALLGRPERVLVTLSHPDHLRPSDVSDVADHRDLAFSVTEARLDYLPARLDRTETVPAGLCLNGMAGPGFAMRPEEDLRAWVLRRTGLPLSALAASFESLGDNCEFGLVQRACDTEPLGLLRFAGTHVNEIVRGIETDFHGIGAPEDIDPVLSGDGGGPREYMVHEARFGLVYHTFVYEGERSPDAMRQQEAKRLTFLRRKFLDELDAGEKIFLFRSNPAASEAEILPLWQALNGNRPNTLFWVVPADATHPPGMVEVVMDGLLKGYIERFAPSDQAHDFLLDAWVGLCVNAFLLNRLIRRLT